MAKVFFYETRLTWVRIKEKRLEEMTVRCMERKAEKGSGTTRCGPWLDLRLRYFCEINGASVIDRKR